MSRSVAETVEIHVLGANQGESIIIGLPGNVWGVVDTYAPKLSDPQSNPTIRFLERRKIDRLEFLCLTHPHADHIKGASYLLKNYPVKRFWGFGALTPPQLYVQVVNVLRQKAQTLHNSDDIEEVETDLLETLATVRTLIKTGAITEVRLALGLPVFEMTTPGNCPIKITALGPSGEASAAYESKLNSCFDKTHPKRVLVSKIPSIDHNLISTGLLLEFGKARIVLGGDIERDGWTKVLAWDSPRLLLKSHVVKASHHGSANGYCANLWETHLSPGQCAVAVITPFIGKGLPTADGLDYIRRNSKKVFLASTTSVRSRIASGRISSVAEWPLDAQLALNQVFTNLRPDNVSQGMCSFKIDRSGKVKVSCAGDAGKVG